MEEQKKEYKSFGYSNGWAHVPFEVFSCRKQGHITKTTEMSRGVSVTVCPICMISYLTDSSD